MSQQPITIDDIYALFRTSQEELQRSREEYDRRAAEASRSMEALRRSVTETTRAVNGLTSRWGRFVEELVEPAVVRMFQERGINVKENILESVSSDKGWRWKLIS
jgi:hypothetical protein